VSDAAPGAEGHLRRAREVKETSRERLRAYPNVTGVGVGYKEVSGERTDRVAIRVYVARKVPRDQLADQDILPDQIDDVPIDVIEARFEAHASTLLDDDHRSRRNPLLGGISIGNVLLGGSGTLGGSLFDNRTQQDMILSNWHVLCGRADCASGEPIIQPGTGGGDTGQATDVVGRLLRSALTDEVDAAIARLSGDRFLLRELLGVGPFSGVADPVLGLSVTKSGRTTGVTTAVVTDVSADADVNGYPGGSRSFRNQVVIEDSSPSEPGDSGSLWLDQSAHVVALNFAGSPGRAIANRIIAVLETLDINVDRGITMQSFVAATNTLLH
jgi:hypothetical protein